MRDKDVGYFVGEEDDYHFPVNRKTISMPQGAENEITAFSKRYRQTLGGAYLFGVI